MSVYNRKMFKRNAREKLNQSAGIQAFQQGGTVNPQSRLGAFTGALGESIIDGLFAPQGISGANLAKSGIGFLLDPDPFGQEQARKRLEDMKLREQVMRDVVAKQQADAEALRQKRISSIDLLRGQPMFDQLRSPTLTDDPTVGVPDTPPTVSGPPLGEFEGLSPIGGTPIEDAPYDDAVMREARKADPAQAGTTETPYDDAVIRTAQNVDDMPNVDPTQETVTPETVAKALTADPQTQQDQLKILMKEFTQNAPEYNGMDKGLALAKIGFAMAAGESPNAIQNIATAMEDGADMFIKDKQQRDAFNRQVQLSALQYGLGEVGKQRAEARLAKREDDKLKYFIADADVTIGDKTYTKGNVVPISQGYIRENGLPKGVTTENLSKAAIDKAAEVQKALREAAEKKVMSDKDYRENRKIIVDASDTFTKARNLQTLLEGQMFNVSEGKITGISPAAKSLLNKAANAVDVDLGAGMEDLERYNKDMRQVANELIKELLGEGSKNISNVDRQLAQEIVGLYTQYSYITADEDVLLDRLQGVYSKLQTAQRNALTDMEDILNISQGRVTQSGAQVTYGRVGDIIGSVRGEQGQLETVKLGDLLTDGVIDQKKVSSIFGGS